MFLLHQDIFLWDFLILLAMTFSLSGGIACVILARRKARSVCQSLLGLLGTLGIVCFAVITYGAFIEPQLIVVTRAAVTHPNAPTVRIAIISDPHLGPYKGKRFMQRVVSKTNALLPDLVLLPGDFVFTRSADLTGLSPLRDLRATAGAFAVLGNHDVGQYLSLAGKRYSGSDRGDKIEKALMDYGIAVLRNEQKTINLPDGTLSVSGIDDIWTGHADLSIALDTVPEDSYAILLSHNPSVIDEPRARDAHLIVSGHTHGGQIRLPVIGSLTTLPTSLGNDYDQGVFTVDEDTDLVITRGIGESSPRMRLLAWPEVFLLEVSQGE